MKIQLETLQHQVDALNAIDAAFHGMDKTKSPGANYIYANPLIKDRYDPKSYIDIKMETGTGKTYVYTRMMYELHRKYGLFKFVIAVPTPSIKEGTRSFITSDYAKQHFRKFYENTRIQLNVINAGDFGKRAGRHNFPPQLSEFVEATRQNANQIEVLLVNQGMLHSKNMTSNDYDQTLLGGETCPQKAIAATRPVVIIDEPQKFKRTKAYYKDIDGLKPQLIVRFGATFPETTTGRGKNKIKKIDYYRGKPQFDLNAVESFNQGLVKGVDIYYPDIPESQAKNLYNVYKTTRQELVLKQGDYKPSVAVGENLADADPGFEGGITYEGGNDHRLSNGLTVSKGMKLIPGTFAKTYQYQIISQAIDRHFTIEQENFLRPSNLPKIKTLSLYFIDSIASIRTENNGKGWLIQEFESLLTKKLNGLIDKYSKATDQRKIEYCDFLKATLSSLKSAHQEVYAAYFSKDRHSTDADIERQVDDILRNKEKLLSFKDRNGNWITRRFLFSKWTLREGWDNPNVFVIAKLRSSGSETSKIQEVGRGLRLPVDEFGHRLTYDEWQSRLSFLIGYDERDFAQTLVGDINDDAPIELNHDRLTEDMIQVIVKARKQSNPMFDADKLLYDLDAHNVINRNNDFKDSVQLNGEVMSGYEALTRLYPELEHQTRVEQSKIRDRNSKAKTRIKLRKQNWEQLKSLWLQLSQRQMIEFDSSVNNDVKQVAESVFADRNQNIFVLDQPQIHRQAVVQNADKVELQSDIEDLQANYDTMNYGDFLESLTKATDLPVNLLNNLMIRAMKRMNNDVRLINDRTLANLAQALNDKIEDKIQNSYTFEPLNFRASTSIYDSQKHTFVDSVPASVLGVHEANSAPDIAYLYERPPLRYDSTMPELNILQHKYGPKITVFGKLPKKAIKIPRFDHGTTTPDFVFKIEHGDHPVYLMIETKAKDMRFKDAVIGKIQEEYFKSLKNAGFYYRLATSDQQVHELISAIKRGEEPPRFEQTT